MVKCHHTLMLPLQTPSPTRWRRLGLQKSEGVGMCHLCFVTFEKKNGNGQLAFFKTFKCYSCWHLWRKKWHDGKAACISDSPLDSQVDHLARWPWPDPSQKWQTFILDNAISDRFQGPMLTAIEKKRSVIATRDQCSLSSWAQPSMTSLMLCIGA